MGQRFCHSRARFLEVVAQFVRARIQILLLKHVEHGERGFAGDRISGEGASQAAGAGSIHDFRAAGDRSQRQSAANRLRGDEDVGLDAVALAGKQRARAAEAALHFVGDEQHSVLVADVDQNAEIILRGATKPPSPSTGSAMTAATPSAATTRLNVSSRWRAQYRSQEGYCNE